MKRFSATLLFAAMAIFALTGARQRAARPAAPPVVDGPTFNKEIVRLFQQNCQTCHRPGDIAPFSLMTYAEAKPYASLIKLMTRTRQMPPWKPADGCGEFEGKRVLSQSEIDLISKWADNGAPEGNPTDLPSPIDFGSGWTLGAPDVVLSYPEAYTPPAQGDMYRCFTIPTNLTSDQYVAGIDIRPGDRTLVHHVIAYIDTTGESVRLDENDPGPGYTSFGGPGFAIVNPDATTLGGWAPGYRPFVLPDGVAMSLPAGSRVVLQVHYHPHHGKTGPDKTEIGIYYAKRKPAKLLRILPVLNTTFTIPPGASNYEVKATFPFLTPWATHLWVIAPHMHLLGKKMKVEATPLNGPTQCLINIEDWDFNWQNVYRFKNPIPLPAGSRLSLTAYFDNSENNPRNPNQPPKSVSWGEATTDEMCIAFIGYTRDSEDLTR
ncbi:MAG TPA: ascorbate-dependent monooxygenase [Thermoanaerobaculia bacterium]|nr:ascorbate-dependent monooxygenase [Thermoanaerobaculia bacterium]